MTSLSKDYGLEKYRKVEDKMTEKKQKTFYLNRVETKLVMDYLNTLGNLKLEKYQLKNEENIEIKFNEKGNEIICNCNNDVIKGIEEIISRLEEGIN